MPLLIVALILGIVEGLTEFAPVSSTGHLILAGSLLHFTNDTAKTFEIVIQLGSILAVVVVFWKRLWSLFGFYRNTYENRHLNLLHIVIGMIPAVVVGLVLHDFIKNQLFSPGTVIIGLVAGGILMIFADIKHRAMAKNSYGNPEESQTLDQLTYRQAFYIGLFQVLALWPGFSRSGATISGGVLTGVNYKTSAEFSFIMAVPIMFAASGLDLFKSMNFLNSSDIPLFMVGFITAFIVAMLAIVFFLRLLSKVKLMPFAIYRFILAIVFAVYMYVIL